VGDTWQAQNVELQSGQGVDTETAKVVQNSVAGDTSIRDAEGARATSRESPRKMIGPAAIGVDRRQRAGLTSTAVRKNQDWDVSASGI
jgi:hypothetical protein